MQFYHAFCSSGEWFLLSVLPCRTVHRRISFARLGQSRKLLEACGPVGGNDISRGPHRIFDLDRPQVAQTDGLKSSSFRVGDVKNSHFDFAFLGCQPSARSQSDWAADRQRTTKRGEQGFSFRKRRQIEGLWNWYSYRDQEVGGSNPLAPTNFFKMD